MIWNDDAERTTGISREEKYGISKITYVDIVRCEDCKNKKCWEAGNVVCGIDGKPHRPDWFCADGKGR